MAGTKNLFLIEFLQRSEEITRVAVLVGVPDELRVQLLVAVEGDPAVLLVLCREQLLVSFVELLDALVGHAVDAVEAVLVGADAAVAVNVDRPERAVDKELKGFREIGVRLSLAGGLDTALELVHGDFAVFVKVGQFGDLVPEVEHDLGVLLVHGLGPVTLVLDDGVSHGQALEVVFIEEAVVVDVVHVADDKLDAVVPRIGHRE